jgi:hypothetical protein
MLSSSVDFVAAAGAGDARRVQEILLSGVCFNNQMTLKDFIFGFGCCLIIQCL